MDWFLLAWQRAAEFSGRSRRKEYWMFFLFNALIVLALFVAAAVIDRSAGTRVLGVLAYGYCMLSFVPTLSLTVRRLHDIGKSGWWYFIGFIPVLGGIILFVFTVLDGDSGSNEYGPNPKIPAYGGVMI